MIAKITRGENFYALAQYLHGPGKDNEHHYDDKSHGQVIASNVATVGERFGDWYRTMQRIVDRRKAGVVKPSWQVSLRAAPDDPVMTDRQWKQIARTFLAEMGCGEHPFVVVRHGGDHVHVVVNRVGFDKSLWHARNDFHNVQKACRVIEKDFRLTAVESGESKRRRGVKRELVESRAEYRRSVEFGGKFAPRVELARRLKIAVRAARGTGQQGFEQALRRAGVELKLWVRQGKTAGASFRLEDHLDKSGKPVWVAGGKLGEEFAWQHIEEALLIPRHVPQPEVVKGRFESQTKYQARVQAEWQFAVNEDMRHIPVRLADVSEMKKRLASRQEAHATAVLADGKDWKAPENPHHQSRFDAILADIEADYIKPINTALNEEKSDDSKPPRCGRHDDGRGTDRGTGR